MISSGSLQAFSTSLSNRPVGAATPASAVGTQRSAPPNARGGASVPRGMPLMTDGRILPRGSLLDISV
jgi:hypothetical protein